MTIIQIEKTNGLHPVKTWHMGLDTIPEGWAFVPEGMVAAAFASGGYCEIKTEQQTVDGVECELLTSLMAMERPVVEEPDMPPTTEELAAENKLLKAQIGVLENELETTCEVLTEVLEHVMA